MTFKEKLKEQVWNNVGFWRFQFFVDLVIIIILILTIFYLLGEYEYVVNELLRCINFIGD